MNPGDGPRLRLATSPPRGDEGIAPVPAPWRLGLLAVLGAGLGSSAAWGGLYDISAWGPAAIVILAGALAVVVAAPAALAIGARLVLGGLIALAALAALSMTWSESPPAAAIEAHRWALYGAVFLLAAALVRDERARRVLLTALVLGALAVHLVLVVQLLGPDAQSRFFVNRLTFPMGYVNGQAAALAATVWPLLAVAEHARSLLLRGAAAGLGVVLIGLTLLTQSRGGLAVLALTAVALLVLFAGRVRRAWLLLVVGAFVALVGGELVDVYSQAPAGRYRPDTAAVHRAVAHLLLAGAGAGALWAAASAVARRPFAATAPARRIGAAALATIALAGACAVVVVVGDPVQRVRTQADQFTRLDASTLGGARLLSGGGNRYDFWRVAVAELRAHPVAGVGAGNYAGEYYARRRNDESIRQPHSLQLQQLAELGVLGGTAIAVLVAGLGWLVLAAARAAGREHELSAGSAVAATGMLVAWVLHTSVDWLHLLPGLTGAALCAAACLVRPLPTARRQLPGRRLAAVLACAVAVCVAGAGIGRLTLAAREGERARTALTERADPRRAIELAARSLELQPQDLSAMYTQAAGWARLDDYRRARAVLLRASGLEPSNPVPHALLADLAVRRGDLEMARREYAAAARLNPRDRSLRAALGRIPPR